MNILMLDSIDPTVYGGMEEWIRLSSDAFAKRGHNVYVGGRRDSRFLDRISRRSSATPVSIPFSSDFNPSTIWMLRRFLKANEIDIITVNFNKELRLAGLATSMGKRCPIVWSLGIDLTGGGFIHHQFTPRVIDLVICCSEDLKREVCHRGYVSPDITLAIARGHPDLDGALRSQEAKAEVCRKFDIPTDAVIGINSARFVEHKGHTYLIDALAIVADRLPHLHLLWLGDGSWEQKLRDQANDRGVADRIHFGGWQEQVHKILAGCDLMIQPSIIEPMGNSLLEGMRAGLPIIASRVGGMPEVIVENETGLLVEPRNPEALAAALEKLVGNPELMAQYGVAGRRRFLTHYTIDAVVDRWEQIFEDLIEKHKNHGSSQTA